MKIVNFFEGVTSEVMRMKDHLPTNTEMKRNTKKMRIAKIIARVNAALRVQQAPMCYYMSPYT